MGHSDLLAMRLATTARHRRLLRVRRVPAWRSATMGVDGLDSYIAFGYANPTRRVLAGLLHTRSGASDMVEVVEAYLYRPALRSPLGRGETPPVRAPGRVP